MIIRLPMQKALQERLQDKKNTRTRKIIYLDDSKTWYMDKEQVNTYLELYNGGDYSKGMLEGEKRLIEDNIDDIVKQLPEKYSFIDLGPGTADKSGKIIRESILKEKEVNYHAIDINEFMLETALKNIEEIRKKSKDKSLTVQGYLGDFTEHFSIISKQIMGPKFIYLGSTFVNYDPKTILKLYSQNMDEKDQIYISAQKPYNIKEIIKQYSVGGYNLMMKPMLAALGFTDVNKESSVRFENGAIEHFIKIDELTPTLKDCANIGDEIVTFTSRKPTKEQFENSISKRFKGEYYENDTHIAFIGNKLQRSRK